MSVNLEDDELTQVRRLFHCVMEMYKHHVTTCSLCQQKQPCEIFVDINDLANKLAKRAIRIQVEELKASGFEG